MMHKARPAENDPYHCAVCRSGVKRVPGGSGPTYVHELTGAVVASGNEEAWCPLCERPRPITLQGRFQEHEIANPAKADTRICPQSGVTPKQGD